MNDETLTDIAHDIHIIRHVMQEFLDLVKKEIEDEED